MNPRLPALTISMMRSTLTDRAKLARVILDRELRPLLPATLTARIGGRLMTLDTARMDDEAIVTLTLVKPPATWTRLTLAAVKAMRACIWVAERPDDHRAVDHLTLALADVVAAQAKHAATSEGGKAKAVTPAIKAKVAKVQEEAAKPRPHVHEHNKTTLIASRAGVDRKTVKKHAPRG